MRYIVTSLTDEFCSELSEELMVATPLVLDDSHSDEDSMEHWDTWTPDPVHAHTRKDGGKCMSYWFYLFLFTSCLLSLTCKDGRIYV